MTVSRPRLRNQDARSRFLPSSAIAGIAVTPVNDNALESLPLFDYFGLRVVGDNRPSSRRARSWWLSVDTRLCFGEYSYQLYLPMSSEEFNNVVRLVPLMRYPALDNHFPSVVRRDETLSKLAVKLAYRRKLRLGDVVQMSEAELLGLLNGNKRALERLRSHLQAYELEFGMRAPRWKSPGGLLCPDW